MYARTYRRPGVGQIEDETTRAIMDLRTKLPPVMTSLEFQPGFTPVAGQPGAFTVRMAAAGGVMAWLEKNRMLVYVGAGTLLMLAMISPARRRRR